MKEKTFSTHCGVCDQSKKDGIYLYHMFICHECEKEIVATNPSDSHYDYFVKKLKAINQTTSMIQ
ncbi:MULTISPECIES: sigma factor G inhibitor Gin [Gracilibacillus]|uniref:Sigma-G inhibitor, Gin n=1 Tax=Gracilibacillus dipsosauri TaxID=178340 RepID=A0A317KWN9_9BACI|nr:sigma factor G inhibitor Gin [Gracilibacillus dipsosauri]PWU67855.1 sigma-G inhibitor, Gin [Gracilibacillus dipsosauri]